MTGKQIPFYEYFKNLLDLWGGVSTMVTIMSHDTIKTTEVLGASQFSQTNGLNNNDANTCSKISKIDK